MSLPRPRVVFFGTGEIGLPSLDFLLTGTLPLDPSDQPAAVAPVAEVVAVVTGPDRPSGRGLQLRRGPIAERARRAGVPCWQPASLRPPEVLHQLAGAEADLFIVMAYGKILPPAVLDLPPLGSWNLHASLLPRHRGASPIQSALLAGDTHTGISLMRMEEGLDTGPVLWQEALAIGPEETAGSLHDRLALLAAHTLARGWSRLLDPTSHPTAQDAAQATYARKIEKADGRMDWTQPAEELARRVQAFTPWPGCVTTLHRPGHPPVDLKIWRAQALPTVEATQPPGTLCALGPAGLEVATGRGFLRLLECQLPGKKRLPVADFLRGCPLETGLVFGAPPTT